MSIEYVYSKLYLDTEKQLFSFHDEYFKNNVFNILESLFLYDYDFFVIQIHKKQKNNLYNKTINFPVKNFVYKKELTILIKLAIQFSIYKGIQCFNSIHKDEPYFLEKLKQLNNDYILINKEFFDKIQEHFSLSIEKIKIKKYIQNNLIKDF